MGCLQVAAIGLHLASLHIPDHNPRGKVYNDLNPGAYVVTECGLTVGAYYNSYDRLTVNAGYHYEPPRLPVFVEAGVATGYPGHPLVPYVYPGIRIGPLRIGVIPHIPGLNNTTVIHSSIQMRF